MGGVDEHHACDFGRVLGREYADILAPDRVTDQHIRTRHWSALQQFVQIANDGCAVACGRRGVAPTLTGAVIPANGGELRNLRLNFAPAITTVAAAARFQDPGRTTGARAIDVQAVAANIDRTSNSESMLAVSPSADLFRGEPQEGSEEKREEKAFQEPLHQMAGWHAHGCPPRSGVQRFMCA